MRCLWEIVPLASGQTRSPTLSCLNRRGRGASTGACEGEVALARRVPSFFRQNSRAWRACPTVLPCADYVRRPGVAAEFGAHARIRTGDLFLTKEMLYRLSYVGGAALRFYLLDTDGQIHVRHRSGARQGKATAASSDACAGGRRTCPGCPARRHANLGAARTRR